MYNTQLPFIELYNELLKYDGEDAYSDILEMWPKNNPSELHWIAGFKYRTNSNWTAATDEDLCRLYSLFRVTSILLLPLQSGRVDGTDYQGPNIEMTGLQLFLEQLGFQVPDVTGYHPFFHEILRVNQDERNNSPVKIVEFHWPCFMLGDMMFLRSGVSVSAGSSHVVKEVAESSKLYWTFRRKDRRFNDESSGWGHNSQWRTAHRRDYRANESYYFNVDGPESLNNPNTAIKDVSVNAMIELVRNRCMVQMRIDDSDLYPYLYSYVELIGVA